MDEYLWSKMANKYFLKEIFLGGNFGEHVLEEQILLRRKFCQQTFLEFFASKMSFGGRKNTG